MSGTERESACLMGPEVVIKNLFDRPRAHLREGLQGQAGPDTGAPRCARGTMSLRTEQAYAHWMRRFVTFHRLQSPRTLGPEAVKESLAYLAEARQVSASTQNQALNALVFLYEQVLGEPLSSIGEFTRAKRPKRLPVVLTRDEVNHRLAELSVASPGAEISPCRTRMDLAVCISVESCVRRPPRWTRASASPP
jgi:integrase